MRMALVSRGRSRHLTRMDRKWADIAATALIASALAACAPASAQQGSPQDGGLRPPPAYEREYRDYCRDRPAACAGGYGQARDDFLTRRQDDAVETIRRRELESLHQLQQQQLRR
jgi:hypothetical protein